jgi:hypothetical protein
MSHLPTCRVGARRWAARVMAAGVVAGVVATVPGTAWAGPSDSVTTVSPATALASTPAPTPVSSPRCTPGLVSDARQRVEANLAARAAQLNVLLAAVDNTANRLTTSDRQALDNDIATVGLPGIQALQRQVPLDTTCLQLWAAAQSMVYDFRVYVVMTPQTHLAIVMDGEVSIVGVFVSLEPTIASAIQRAQARGKDVTAAQAAFDDLKSQLGAAQRETTGQAAQILAQTPHGFPGSTPVFWAARTHAVNARRDLATAYADAQHIRTDLQ